MISAALSPREPLDAAAPGAGRPPTAPGDQAGRSGDALPCAPCLRRTWLVGALAGRVEHARQERGGRRIALLLA
ncbi:MAG TPA: hypothetical protein VIL49_03090, partial [Capillimicrobium sp.]